MLLFFFVQLLPILIIYSSHIFSIEVQVVFVSLSFIWRHFAFVIKFVFIGHKFLDVINVCCYCLILLIVLTRFLYNGRSHQSNASFFTPLCYLLWRLSYCSYFIFLKNIWFFGGFLSVPHLIDNNAKIEAEQCRKLISDLTLLSQLCFSKIG